MRANQLKTIHECLKAIERIELTPCNVIGGNKAFFSGYKTELTLKAKRQVLAIEKQIDKLSEGIDEDA